MDLIDIKSVVCNLNAISLLNDDECFQKSYTTQLYKIVYVVRGKALIHFNERNCALSTGCMLIVKSPVKVSMIDNLMEYYFLECSGQLIDYYLTTDYKTGVQMFRLGLNDELIRLFKQLIDLNQNKTTGFHTSGIIAHIIGLVKYESYRNQTRLNHNSDIIQLAKKIINDNLYSNISGKQVAANLNMSYSLFRKQFKLHLGQTPSQYIAENRIEKSKDYLLNTRMTVNAISDKMKFRSVDTFIYNFKKRTGQNPSVFRKKL